MKSKVTGIKFSIFSIVCSDSNTLSNWKYLLGKSQDIFILEKYFRNEQWNFFLSMNSLWSFVEVNVLTSLSFFHSLQQSVCLLYYSPICQANSYTLSLLHTHSVHVCQYVCTHVHCMPVEEMKYICMHCLKSLQWMGDNISLWGKIKEEQQVSHIFYFRLVMRDYDGAELNTNRWRKVIIKCSFQHVLGPVRTLQKFQGLSP